MRASAAPLVTLALVLVAPATAADRPTFSCHGERIEKGQSTWGYARASGDQVRIETTSSSVGFAFDRGSRWAIESFGRSTLGWLANDRIEHPNGATWTTIDSARRFASCSDVVAASLWVLNENGKL
jgi:hypothetical protein